MSEIVERVSLLTHSDWCKCLDRNGIYGLVIDNLESDPRAGDLILLTWERFKARADEALK